MKKSKLIKSMALSGGILAVGTATVIPLMTSCKGDSESREARLTLSQLNSFMVSETSSWVKDARTQLSGNFSSKHFQDKGMLESINNSMNVDSYFYAFCASVLTAITVTQTIINDEFSGTSVTFSNIVINVEMQDKKMTKNTRADFDTEFTHGGSTGSSHIHISVLSNQGLCAAGKNVVDIGVGMADGLVFGQYTGLAKNFSIDGDGDLKNYLHETSPDLGCTGGAEIHEGSLLKTLFPNVPLTN
jgi:hypothetical protein